MIDIHRLDDFRCHDQNLVQILPGREDEAVDFAIGLHNRGYPIGLLIKGSDITNWSFLKKAGVIGRFEFIDFSNSLKSSDLESIHAARLLRIAGRKFGVDFSLFKSLETLFYRWSGDCVGLEAVDTLRAAYLYEIGAQKNAEPMPLASGVETLFIFNYRRDSISFMNEMKSLTEITIERARNIRKMPSMDNLRKVEIKNVGRDEFDYSSLPLEVQDVEIDSCAPISNWEFLLRSDNLRRLVIWKTDMPPIDADVRKALDKIEVVDFHPMPLELL